MATYKVISLDVWGHGPNHEQWGCDGNCDGWTVNNAFYTGRTVAFAQDASDEDVARALVEAGELMPKCVGKLKIDGESDWMLFVEYEDPADEMEDGFPLLHLEFVSE